MFLEKIIIPPTIPEQITKEIAQTIYWQLKEYRGVSQAFTNGWYPFCYYEDVKQEIEALEQIVMQEMNKPYKDIEDNIISLELRPTSRDELLERLSSDILDTDIFLTDYMDYVMVYKEDTDWEDFASQFISSTIE